MTKGEVRKAFEVAGGHTDLGYFNCWLISLDGFEKFLETVADGADTVTANEITSVAMFHALHDTQGRFDSQQDQAVAILEKLMAKLESIKEVPSTVTGNTGSAPSAPPAGSTPVPGYYTYP